METLLRCSVTEETHETRLEIVQDATHRAQVILDADDLETLIMNLAQCRAENPTPLSAEIDDRAMVVTLRG